MTIAAKHLDPLVGLDVHIILIPTPAGPVPTPLPHPYIGMVFDPMDYVPTLGATVWVNGLPRGQAGSSGQALPPHVPMGGPFAKPPSNESEIFMGSATVLFDGEPQSFLGLPVLSCQDIGMPAPPRPKKKSIPKSLLLPTTVVLAIPMGMLVMIGGPPTISMTGMAMKAGLAGLKKLKKLGPIARKIKGASDRLHGLAAKAMKKLGLGDGARNAVHKAICTVTGHPVDVATGKVFTDAVDLELPGPIPFRFERTWFSTSTYEGPLGHGWHHSYDQALVLVDAVLLYRTGDGRHIGLPPIARDSEYFDRKEKLTIARELGGYAIRTHGGLTHRFAAVGRSNGELALKEIANDTGQRLQFHYDARGRLTYIIDCAGRTLEFESDAQGRITGLIAPHPTDSAQRFYVSRYGYDSGGNLAVTSDALGHAMNFAYQRHLLARETNRNGLSFYFEWDAADETARCVRTWGDGGIYDHKLRYDVDTGTTVVENSLGHKTVYTHQGGVVLKTLDALGAVTEVEYSEHNELSVATNALGLQTKYSYDERGNLRELVGPDGATLKLESDVQDRTIRVVDVLGGEWTWQRDPQGRVLERKDPLGRVTRFEHGGARLVAVIDPAGGRTALAHDAEGNVTSLTAPDGGRTEFEHDFLGRLAILINAKGSVERRHYDLMHRVVAIDEPDQNRRILAYDAEGNLTHAHDCQYDVRFTYQGMNRLASRTQGNTAVRFEYDTEEQLIGIINEHGRIYGFEFSPTGEVDAESGFDGVARRYTRDRAGRALRVDRTGGRFSSYSYDAAGRVTAVTHSDGSRESYSHRRDGTLIAATNAAAVLGFERDALGRILQETQDNHWVRSEYDALGLRSRVTSSAGLDQRIERNIVGDVTRVTEEGSGYETSFTRDPLGLELERAMPGGVRSRWQRDKLGRPLQHTVEGKTKLLRAVGYRWEPSDRLSMLLDGLTGPTEYGHDPLGYLAWARYSDGSVDLRMPDAVGNLFRSNERNDRQYGPAGELIASHTAHGLVRYRYDAEGNLIEKTERNGRSWRYEWNDAGMLAKVLRPDGSEITFAYDPLGRRVAKTYRGQTTRWVWDGNTPLHEWVEGTLGALPTAEVPALWAADADIKKREAELLQHLSQGPPTRRGTSDAPITWLFQPESFAPMAKLTAGESLSIVSDHLGTPVLMSDTNGLAVWSAGISVYGELRNLEGDRFACPFRWPGQYEDAETGLYYNRFRYYDPEAGQYTSQDPIRTIGGISAYGYVSSPTAAADPLGLACNTIEARREKIAYNFYRRAGFSHERALSHIKGIDFSRPVSVQRLKSSREVTQWRNPASPAGNYFTDPGVSASELGINPAGRSEELFVVTKDSRALTSTAAPITDTWTDPTAPFDAAGGGRQFFVPQNGNLTPKAP